MGSELYFCGTRGTGTQKPGWHSRIHCKLKTAPAKAPTSLSHSHSCTHNLNAVILQERGNISALGSSACLCTADKGRRKKQHPALYSCLLPFAGVSSAVATLLRVDKGIRYPLRKEFFNNPLLFWLAQTSRGLREFGSSEHLRITHYWHRHYSLPSPATTPPSHIIHFPEEILAISRPYLDLCVCLSCCYVTPP